MNRIIFLMYVQWKRKLVMKHVIEIIYATRTLSISDFPSPNRINSEFDIGGISTLRSPRVRVRVNFTHGICNVMNYVERTALSGN